MTDKLKDTKLDAEVLYGNEGYNFIASHEKVTTVVAAITGSAGLISTIEAAKNSKQILLAKYGKLNNLAHCMYFDECRPDDKTK